MPATIAVGRVSAGQSHCAFSSFGCTLEGGWHCVSVMVSGDDDFEALFREEMPSVVATVWRITDDRAGAEEIAQDAFAKALVRWRRVGRYDRPGAWVRRVAIRDAVRAAERARRSQALLVEPSWVAPPMAASDPELLDAVRALPGQQRAAVVLFYLEDRPAAEVAEFLSCSQATVRSHLRRARHALADRLGDADDEGAFDNARR